MFLTPDVALENQTYAHYGSTTFRLHLPAGVYRATSHVAEDHVYMVTNGVLKCIVMRRRGDGCLIGGQISSRAGRLRSASLSSPCSTLCSNIRLIRTAGTPFHPRFLSFLFPLFLLACPRGAWGGADGHSVAKVGLTSFLSRLCSKLLAWRG